MSAFETKAWIHNYAEWTKPHLDYGDETLVDFYTNNREKNGNKSATYFFGRTQTYSELDQQVHADAAGLRAFGIRPGDRVALVLPNCPQHIAAFYAVLKLGATVVEHNPLYTAHELEGLFKDHGARVAIVWDKAAPTVDKLRETTDLETIISVNMTEAMPRRMQLLLRIPIPPIAAKREALTGDAPNTVPWATLCLTAIGGSGKSTEFPKVTREDTALILYTSGTTGQPKGALLSHGNLASMCVMGEAWVPGLRDKQQRFLATLPMFHVYGLMLVAGLGPYVGAEMVLLPAPQIPLIIDVLKKHTPTFAPGVPTLYETIIQVAKENDIALTGIDNAVSGASALPGPTVEDWENLTGGKSVEGYGLTETSPVICGNPMNGKTRPGYVGLPFPDTEVRIAAPEDLDKTMPDGEEGELLVRGPQVFSGYLNK